jgi:hypothetical protein
MEKSQMPVGDVLSVKITPELKKMVKEMKEIYHRNISSLVREFIQEEYAKIKKSNK